MASNVRVVFDDRTFRALLRSDGVRADLERRAQRIAAAAGEGYEAASELQTNRARASVRTVGPAAAMDEAIDHTLLRAIDAGR
jgi:hypothetical protein